MRFALLLLFVLLSACSITPEKKAQLVYSDSVPATWMIAGKISATLNGNNKMVDFELYHKNERNRLILKGALGLFQMEIKQSDQGLLVDGKLMKLSLAKWMRFKFGWHFPISELENIIFKHHISTLEKWQIKISKYQVINTITYPKLIRLQHTRNPIKIKLLIRQLNQGV